jgi:L-arabinose isomerase
MIDLSKLEVWFVTGSQHLYGEDVLKTVEEHAQEIAKSFDINKNIPVQITFKPVVKTPDEIYKLCQDANTNENCIGIITWMHTFSPAKMWIRGLQALQKPMCHLHTQFNRDIPFSSIDMDFMNLNQSAHGDREFGFIMSRMRLERKVIVGHWQDPSVLERLNVWTRAAAAFFDWQGARFARFGDNMRQVAVTEGDKVEAELQFGYSVNGYGVGDLVKYIDAVSEKEVEDLVSEYAESYVLQKEMLSNGTKNNALKDAAKIEIGLKNFLKQGAFKGYTNTFEDLHGMKQLPGIASQRLMAAGYGFGAEGDWKTAALVRAAKVMASGMAGGNSFMEDYTYHFEPQNSFVLGAHMLEICPSIAKNKPNCEIHPLGIGGKDDPVRLVFDADGGPAHNVSMVHLGNRFRLILNEVEAIEPTESLPKLPVARVLWKPLPNMQTGCAAWIYAGGAHHTVYSQNLTTEYWEDFASMIGVELVLIDKKTDLRQFRNELRWNEVYYKNK